MDGWMVTWVAVGGELARICPLSLMLDGGWITVEKPLSDTLTDTKENEKYLRFYKYFIY